MKPSKIKQVLRKMVEQRYPALIVGPPGVGKTKIVEQLAQELGYRLIILHAVVDDPTDYKGMPATVVTPDGEHLAKFLPFGDLYAMIKATEPTLVFFDDLGQAPPAVQAAAMQLILGRRINGHRLSDQVTFVAATNRRQDKAAVVGIITPLLDRFKAVLNFEFDLNDWVQYCIDNNVPPVVTAFAKFKPDLIGKFEPSKDMKKSPTPRSVVGMGELLELGLDDPETLSGAVGEAFAHEFLAFYRTWMELPAVEEIYLNPDTVPIPDRPDVLYALMGSLAFSAKPTNYEATLKFLARCPKDLAVACVKDALARHPNLAKTKAHIKWATANQEVFGLDEAA